jgi:hypothetical protein
MFQNLHAYFILRIFINMRILYMGFGLFTLGCTSSEKQNNSDNQGEDSAGSEVVDSGCAEYRTEYPAGPYGFTVGSIMEDIPGMVDGEETPMSLTDLHQDTSKTVLVIANAFDT